MVLWLRQGAGGGRFVVTLMTDWFVRSFVFRDHGPFV